MPSLARQSPSTSIGLLGSIAGGDPTAWRRFAHIYTPLIYSVCRSSGLQPDDANDVCQDVFQAVLHGISEHLRSPAKGRFRGWLVGIARHKIQDHYRQRQKHFPHKGNIGLPPEATATLAEASDFHSETETTPISDAVIARRAAEALRSTITKQTWDAFWRTTVGNEKASEVAADLGITAKAVRQAKHRVLKRLRTELTGQIDLPTEEN